MLFRDIGYFGIFSRKLISQLARYSEKQISKTA
jgi:hypothetical protein